MKKKIVLCTVCCCNFLYPNSKVSDCFDIIHTFSACFSPNSYIYELRRFKHFPRDHSLALLYTCILEVRQSLSLHYPIFVFPTASIYIGRCKKLTMYVSTTLKRHLQLFAKLWQLCSKCVDCDELQLKSKTLLDGKVALGSADLLFYLLQYHYTQLSFLNGAYSPILQFY